MAGPVPLKATEKQNPEVLHSKLASLKKNMAVNEKASAKILADYFHAKNCGPH